MYKVYEVVLPCPHRYTEGMVRCGSETKSFPIPINIGKADTLCHVVNTLIPANERAHPPRLVEETQESYIYWIFTEPIVKKRKKAKKQPLSSMYALDAEEIKSAYAWIQKHGQSCDKVATGALTYDLESGAIGTTVKIVCPCGEKSDITDYDSW